jgi:DNA-binding CsgD family transcriptional regulator
MLRSSAGRVFFRHELARRAWEDSVEEGRARALHARILAALSEHGGERFPVARLVHHASRAGDATSVRRFAPTAAHEAAALGAHRAAAAHYETALAFAGDLPARARGSLLEALAYESYLTGEIARAIDARVQTLALWQALGDRAKEGENLRWISRLNWFQGHRDEAFRYGVAAVDVLEPLGADSQLAMAYSNLAQLHMLSAETADAVRWGTRAIAMAEALGDDEVLAHALNNVGTVESSAALAAGLPKLERSLELALLHGYQEHVARAYTNIGSVCVQHHDYACAMRHLDAGIEYSRERDLDSWSLYMLGWWARAHLEEGRWAEAAVDAGAVVRRHGVSAALRLPALIALGRVRVRRADPGAKELLDEASRLAAATGELQRIAPVAAARAEAAFLAGRPEQARDEVRAAYELALAHDSAWTIGELAYWLWRAGGLAEPPAPCPEPYALQMRGRWRDAAAAWERIGCPYERAVALGEGDDVAAHRLALEIFEGLGAHPAAAALRQSLRARGVRGVPVGPRPSTRSNPANLTRRQLEILELLAQGLTNADIAARLFIAVKTVDHHVSAILAKLDVQSRGGAAAAAFASGILPKMGSGRPQNR